VAPSPLIFVVPDAPEGPIKAKPLDSGSLPVEADPETLGKHLTSLTEAPSLELARSVHRRVAELLLSDASGASKISNAFLETVKSADVPNPEIHAIAWRCKAEASVYTGRLKQARMAYEEASQWAEESRNPSLLGQILVGRIGVLTAMGSRRDAPSLIKKAERLLTKSGDLVYLAKLHMNLGSAHYHGERYADAHKAYKRAGEAFESAGLKDATWVGLLLNQGIACTHLFKLEDARDLFLRTESYGRELGLDRLIAQAQYNRSSVEVLRGDFRSALRLLEDSESTFDSQGIRDMQAASLLARAEIYLELSMPRDALDLSRSAAEIFQQEEMALDATLARIAEARSLHLLDRGTDAVSLLETVLHFYDRRKIRPRRATVLLHLARAQLSLGHPEKSIQSAHRALRTFQSLGMSQAEAQTRCILAEAHSQRDHLAKAVKSLHPSLEFSGHLPIGTRFYLWALAGRVSRARGQRSQALGQLRRAAGYLEDQRRLIPGLEMRARVFENQVRVYHDLIDLLVDSPTPSFSPVFRLVESARGRGFRERQIGIRGKSPQDLLQRRALLGSLVGRLEELELGEKADQHTDEIRRLRPRILTLEKDISRKVRRLESKETASRRWKGGVDPDELTPLLRRDETLLEFFVLDHKVIALVLQRDHKTLHTLPSRVEDMKTAVESIGTQLDFMAATAARPIGSLDFHREACEADLRALHRMLVSPLADLLPARGRLTIVPHGFLHLVPFECLHDGNDYVHERWDIARCPTADFLEGRRRPVRKTSQRALISGTIEAGPAFVGREIEAVSAMLPTSSVRVLRDPTPDAFLREAPMADILHLSTHGVFREDNPMFSRLSLKDGAIFLADILDHRLKADLVVLSSCSSGRVFTGHGDDLSGVAHGFLASGARRLVASLWRIHDEATEAWMKAFYQTLMNDPKRDPIRALRTAGRQVREQWNHPFYWGGFCIHGS
jgi:CHAT domain-containing protein/tetratricopeptide (TPR) repeat protein